VEQTMHPEDANNSIQDQKHPLNVKKPATIDLHIKKNPNPLPPLLSLLRDDLGCQD